MGWPATKRQENRRAPPSGCKADQWQLSYRSLWSDGYNRAEPFIWKTYGLYNLRSACAAGTCAYGKKKRGFFRLVRREEGRADTAPGLSFDCGKLILSSTQKGIQLRNLAVLS